MIFGQVELSQKYFIKVELSQKYFGFRRFISGVEFVGFFKRVKRVYKNEFFDDVYYIYCFGMFFRDRYVFGMFIICIVLVCLFLVFFR